METDSVIIQLSCDFSVPVSSAIPIRIPTEVLEVFPNDGWKNGENTKFHQYGGDSLKLENKI